MVEDASMAGATGTLPAAPEKRGDDPPSTPQRGRPQPGASAMKEEPPKDAKYSAYTGAANRLHTRRQAEIQVQGTPNRVVAQTLGTEDEEEILQFLSEGTEVEQANVAELARQLLTLKRATKGILGAQREQAEQLHAVQRKTDWAYKQLEREAFDRTARELVITGFTQGSSEEERVQAVWGLFEMIQLEKSNVQGMSCEGFNDRLNSAMIVRIAGPSKRNRAFAKYLAKRREIRAQRGDPFIMHIQVAGHCLVCKPACTPSELLKQRVCRTIWKVLHAAFPGQKPRLVPHRHQVLDAEGRLVAQVAFCDTRFESMIEVVPGFLQVVRSNFEGTWQALFVEGARSVEAKKTMALNNFPWTPRIMAATFPETIDLTRQNKPTYDAKFNVPTAPGSRPEHEKPFVSVQPTQPWQQTQQQAGGGWQGHQQPHHQPQAGMAASSAWSSSAGPSAPWAGSEHASGRGWTGLPVFPPAVQSQPSMYGPVGGSPPGWQWRG